MKPQKQFVKISTLRQALNWGEGWEDAYLRLGKAYDDLLFHYEVRGDLLEHFEKLIEAIQRDEETIA